MRLGHLVCALTLAAAACSGPEKAPAAPPTELLYFDQGSGITVADGQGRLLASDATVAVPGYRRLYTVRGRDVVALDQVGKEVARIPAPAGFKPTVASANGRVALTNGGAEGRSKTTIHVADFAGTTPTQEVTLKGNFVPEAFSTDGQGLFVLEYLPPQAPERYRVRRLNLGTEKTEPLSLRDKSAVPPGAEEEMRGIGRQSVLSPNGQTLYTLYLHQADHQHTRDLLAGPSARGGKDVHAFVHVLSLDQGWAYCLDLPKPFGTHPPGSYAMTLAPDGQTLYVADMKAKKLLKADTEHLKVTKVATLTTETPAGDVTSLTASPDGTRLYLGSSNAVLDIDAAQLRLTRTLPQPAAVLGLTIFGGKLLVGQPGTINRLNVTTGTLLSTLPASGLTSLLYAGNPPG